MHSKWAGVVVLGVAIAGAAQDPPPASRAEVLLQAKDGITQFKLGDPIGLELVFRDPAFPDVRAQQPANKAWVPQPGQATVNSTDYNDLADDVSITPASGWVQWQGKSGHDYMMDAPLDATGVRVPILLNQGYVFREPGHYEITVTTRRMGRDPITTNAVGIDIVERSAEEEAELVKSLEAEIANGGERERKQAAERLAYLPGDDAARAKVGHLLGEDADTVLIEGLAATRNQQLQLDLLKAAWGDPTQPPTFTLQSALQSAEMYARGETRPGWQMMVAAKTDEASRARAAEYAADLDRLIATLPERSGDNRRDTAYFLMEGNTLSAGQAALVKPVVLEEFPRMDPMAQSMLVETRWDAVNDPSLAPALKAMIDNKAQFSDAATALQRLVEIDDGPDSRPYLIAMVCSAQRGLLLNKLNSEKEDRIPEVDECLTKLLAPGEKREHDFDWEQAAQRAARFATPAVLPAVKQGWTNASQDASMLALLIRDAPREAVALLDREPNVDWYPTGEVYEALQGKLPAEVLAWLRRPDAPRSAAYELARFGEPEDRLLLESRLTALRDRWRGREAEMEGVEPNTPAYAAKSEEQELVSSLFGAKAWKLSDEEKRRITDGCVSDFCRRYAPREQSAAQ